MDNELLLFDRLNVIKDVITKYGEQNFYLSFSGGKDSTILHYLVDWALPGNTIPRVFINTGIEYQAIVDFVKDLASKDNRFVILQPTQALKYAQDNYIIFDTLFNLIIQNIEIEDLCAKYGFKDFGREFDCAGWYSFKFFGSEIKVDGYTYMDILDWVLKQRKQGGN